LDLLRVRYRQRDRHGPDVDPGQAISREPNPSSSAEASELAERLRVAVGRLPRRQAVVFCLSCFEQMSSEEVGEQVGISPTAARMLLSRARRRLQRVLKASGGVTQEND
jgi:RNA polymerase sigma-70 factor (ECF subfamily)